MAGKETDKGTDARARIARADKVINAFCIVVKVVTTVFLALSLTGIALLRFRPELGQVFLDFAGDSTFAQLVDTVINRSNLPARELGAINLFAFALSQFALFVFTSILQGLTRDLTTHEKPFRVKTAKQVRRNTLWLALLLLWNVMAGIMILLVAFLLSYLIEYGAYLQEKADEDDRTAYEKIVRNAGTQAGPQVVAAFERRYDDINAVRMRLADQAN